MNVSHRKFLGFEYKRVGEIIELTYKGRHIYRRVGSVRAIFEWVIKWP